MWGVKVEGVRFPEEWVREGTLILVHGFSFFLCLSVFVLSLAALVIFVYDIPESTLGI